MLYILLYHCCNNVYDACMFYFYSPSLIVETISTFDFYTLYIYIKSFNLKLLSKYFSINCWIKNAIKNVMMSRIYS